MTTITRQGTCDVCGTVHVALLDDTNPATSEIDRCADETACQQRLDDSIRDSNINADRAALANHLQAAINSVDLATRTLSELSGPQLFDVEYAEGHAGRDMAHWLNEARRVLSAAAAINPGETGEPR